MICKERVPYVSCDQENIRQTACTCGIMYIITGFPDPCCGNQTGFQRTGSVPAKRVGINKTYFNILKFRTMKIDTPKDMPTHLLKDPQQYITKVGGFLRKTSLDELPQIINILKGDMAIVGPRPALWNQYDLIEERDKYGANDILPGLTGWAQINGRDELPIAVKARLDGEYVKRMGFLMDVRCILGTVISVVKQEGIVEGGTGELERQNEESADHRSQ